jgi:transcriptional regulator with XRE-family HTH domain
MKTLGQRIRELREEMDLSLRELAKKLVVSPAFLSDIELGRRYPSDKVLSDIARELGTSLENLSTYDTRPPIEELRRLAISNPGYGLAFRKVIDKKVTPEELIKLAEQKPRGKKKL